MWCNTSGRIQHMHVQGHAAAISRMCCVLFHKAFISSRSKSCKDPRAVFVTNNDQIGSQFYTWHDSWAVVPCANLWPDWMTKIIAKVRIIFTRFESWAHKLFVRNPQRGHFLGSPSQITHWLWGPFGLKALKARQHVIGQGKHLIPPTWTIFWLTALRYGSYI